MFGVRVESFPPMAAVAGVLGKIIGWAPKSFLSFSGPLGDKKVFGGSLLFYTGSSPQLTERL